MHWAVLPAIAVAVTGSVGYYLKNRRDDFDKPVQVQAEDRPSPAIAVKIGASGRGDLPSNPVFHRAHPTPAGAWVHLDITENGAPRKVETRQIPVRVELRDENGDAWPSERVDANGIAAIYVPVGYATAPKSLTLMVRAGGKVVLEAPFPALTAPSKVVLRGESVAEADAKLKAVREDDKIAVHFDQPQNSTKRYDAEILRHSYGAAPAADHEDRSSPGGPAPTLRFPHGFAKNIDQVEVAFRIFEPYHLSKTVDLSRAKVSLRKGEPSVSGLPATIRFSDSFELRMMGSLGTIPPNLRFASIILASKVRVFDLKATMRAPSFVRIETSVMTLGAHPKTTYSLMGKTENPHAMDSVPGMTLSIDVWPYRLVSEKKVVLKIGPPK